MLEKQKAAIKNLPAWKKYTYAAIAIFALVYLAWSMYGKRPQKPSEGFKPMNQAVDVKKEPGPTVAVKKVPEQAVKRKFPEATKKPSEEWVDTSEVPPAPNGATILTKIDTVTGDTTNEIKMKESPWFAFERNNTIGTGYEMGTQGGKVPVYYRRDLVRVKDTHLIGEVGGKIALDPRERSEAYGKIGVEYRW